MWDTSVINIKSPPGSEKFPGVKVVIGGIYATLCYNHAKKNSGADIIWKGSVTSAFFKMLNQAVKSELPVPN